eukprot:4808793-Amphidinium_carterae.1
MEGVLPSSLGQGLVNALETAAHCGTLHSRSLGTPLEHTLPPLDTLVLALELGLRVELFAGSNSLSWAESRPEELEGLVRRVFGGSPPLHPGLVLRLTPCGQSCARCNPQ